MKKTMYECLRASLSSIEEKDGTWVLPQQSVRSITKEWGIATRALARKGKVSLTLECDIPEFAKAMATNKSFGKFPSARLVNMMKMELQRKLRSILRNGFVLAGKHYNLFACSPSTQREATIVFVDGSREECMDIIYEITTLDHKSHIGAFRDGSGKCFMSKVFARETSTFASTKSLKELNPKAASYLKNTKVLYVKGLEHVNVTPCQNPCDLTQQWTVRTTDPTDGMGYFNCFVGLILCFALGLMSEEAFNHLMEVYEADPRSAEIREALYKAEMPAVIQTRMPGSMKGALHFLDMEMYVDDTCHFIICDSVRKFKQDKDWNGRMDELEIGNKAHRGNGWVGMNAPVIGALIDADVNIMHDVVRYWLDTVEGIFSEDSFESSIATMKFMGAVSAADEDPEDTTDLSIKAMQTNMLLAKDRYIWQEVEKKVRSFVTRMAAGKLAFPGSYPFITVDPHWSLKQFIAKGWVRGNGTEIPTMESGDYYFNNHSCRGLMARSPLTHPNQLKVINLKRLDAYKLYRNVLVLNAQDGIWIDLAGADMDGDKVMLVLEMVKDGFPKRVITQVMNCIHNEPVLNYEEGYPGQTTPLTERHRIDYLVSHAKRSQVGILNDAYSCWQELYCHFKNILKAAKANSVNKIECEEEFACQEHFYIKKNDTEMILVCEFIKGALGVGSHTLDEVQKFLDKVWATIAVLEILQSREVDAPKTGFELTEEMLNGISIDSLPWSIVARRYAKGKYAPVGEEADKMTDKEKTLAAQETARAKAFASGLSLFGTQGYRALTPLGYITDTVSTWWEQFSQAMKSYPRSYTGYLHCLLTDDERNDALKVLNDVKSIKSTYSKTMRQVSASKEFGEDVKKAKRQDIINDTVVKLAQLSVTKKVDMTCVAVACYYACYIKNNDVNEGLTFAWLLDRITKEDTQVCDELCKLGVSLNPKGCLLSVFERGDMQFAQFAFPAPKFAPGVSLDKRNGQVVTVNNNAFLVCDDAFTLLPSGAKWADGQRVDVSKTRNRWSCYLRKLVENSVDVQKQNVVPANDKGMLVLVNTNKNELLELLKQTKNTFTVEVDKAGNTVATIDGNVVASVNIVYPEALSLLNKKVEVLQNTNTDKRLAYAEGKKGTSIKNMLVRIVGDK